MSPLRLNGSTSGYSQLDAPAIAGDQTFTLPGTGGTLDRLNRAGNILQVVNYQTGAYNSGVTTIPVDDTIPQNTEGTEFMTLAITPTNASNKLFILVTAFLSPSNNTNVTGALFQDSTANALTSTFITTGGTYGLILTLQHYMTAGTTLSTTFKFRAGHSAGTTTYFNGIGSRYDGGVLNSGITIMEIAA
jgi:hypothetical protein